MRILSKEDKIKRLKEEIVKEKENLKVSLFVVRV